MTQRSELAHRRAELRARLLTALANRAFTHKTTGLDGLAKRMMAKAAKSAEPVRVGSSRS